MAWKIQLTLEQQGFELHGSTYMQIFFFSTANTTGLHDLQLGDSTDEEPGLQRGDYKIIDFLLHGGQIPHLLPCSRGNCNLMDIILSHN